MSPEDISKLKQMVKTHTWTDIAKEFSCHPDAIRRVAKRLGLRKYILNKASATRDMAIMSYSENHGCKEAALHYKTTIDAIKSARRRVRKRRAKIANAMNGVRFEKFKLACYRMAFKKGRPHLKEDFASWATVKTLEGRNSSIRNLWIDFRYLNENKELEDYESGNVESIIEDDEDETEERDLFELADSLKLSATDRVVFLLRFKEGLDLSEIGKYLQFTEGRASQIITSIKEKIIKLKVGI